MNYRFGFIGVGNMGGALAKAAAKSTKQIVLCDNDVEKAANLARSLGCDFADCHSVVAESEYLFLGVKPQNMADLLKELQKSLVKRPDIILVTMAAGLSMQTIREMAGGDYKVIRIMPNLAVEVGEGEVLYIDTDNVTKADIGRFLNILKNAGQMTGLLEDKFDAGCAVSGCGPAFVFKFIRALAEGGKQAGIDEERALHLAIQTVIGAAKLMEESPLDPETLIKNVCSPGGSTIEGVKKLDSENMEQAIIDAVRASYERNVELGKQ